MSQEMINSKVKQWLDELVGKNLNYITGLNEVVIQSVDWSGNGKLNVLRGSNSLTIGYERIDAVINRMQNGNPIHVDTVLRGGGNERSVIETIIASFPNVGFMMASEGRNKSKNKVIQWLASEVHKLGDILNISDDQYSAFLINSFSHDFTVSLSKPFLLLAGISGTGKTRFVREQAKATGSLADTYCLTPVRPDWHEPSDLLGYISRLNGEAEYIATDVLKFIAKAWRAKVDAGLSLGVNDTDKEQRGYLIVSGAAGDLNAIPPYWLCLDEMNLAPVEQYFADYLSILETREWCWEDDAFKYFSAPLLTAGTLQHLGKLERDKLRKHLGFKNEGEAKAEDELWGLICEYGMGIPFNLIVAGTVNMDETTHGFSRKVIDRALSFDFGEFYPNDYAEFFEPTIGNKTLSYPVLSHANYSQDKLPSIDSDGQKSIDFLNAVNVVLDNTPFKLAYRALNELLLAVISAAPEEEQGTLHLQAIWDDFLMCKVLPRIEGDSDKLMTDDSQQSLLQKLSQCLTTQLAEIWDEEKDSVTARPDLYREKAGAEGDAKVLRIACRSKAKLEWMQKRLKRSGFTSFWP